MVDWNFVILTGNKFFVTGKRSRENAFIRKLSRKLLLEVPLPHLFRFAKHEIGYSLVSEYKESGCFERIAENFRKSYVLSGYIVAFAVTAENILFMDLILISTRKRCTKYSFRELNFFLLLLCGSGAIAQFSQLLLF